MRFWCSLMWIYTSKGIFGITIESSNPEVGKPSHMRFLWEHIPHLYVIVHHSEILFENTCETSCWLDPPMCGPTSIMSVNGSFSSKLHFKDSDWAANFCEWSRRVGMCAWGVSGFSDNCRCLFIFFDEKWQKTSKTHKNC